MGSPENKGMNAEEREALLAEGRDWFKLVGAENRMGELIKAPDGTIYRAEEFPLAYGEDKYMQHVHGLYLMLKAHPEDAQMKTDMKRVLNDNLDRYQEGL